VFAYAELSLQRAKLPANQCWNALVVPCGGLVVGSCDAPVVANQPAAAAARCCLLGCCQGVLLVHVLQRGYMTAAVLPKLLPCVGAGAACNGCSQSSPPKAVAQGLLFVCIACVNAVKEEMALTCRAL
jgi:hypothetical protein